MQNCEKEQNKPLHSLCYTPFNYVSYICTHWLTETCFGAFEWLQNSQIVEEQE